MPTLFGNGNLESGFIDRILFTTKLTENNILSKKVSDDLKRLQLDELVHKYKISKKNQSKVEKAKLDVVKNGSKILQILYRPFDKKSCIYTGVSNGIMGRPREGIMRHFINKNYGLALTKVNRGISSGYSFILNSI